MFFRERRIDQIWGWIFSAALVSMLWVVGTVEVKAAPLGVAEVSVQSGKTQTGGKHTTSQLGPYRCAEEVKPPRVPKPQRNPGQGSSCKKARRTRSRRQKSRKVQICQRQKRRGKDKPLEEESLPKVITRKVDSGPILDHYINKMGVVSIIDRIVPSHPNRKISHGEAVAALMIYLLNGGRALYQMEKWAEEITALDHIFPNYQPSDWTDDRLADTLDELYKAKLEPMQGSISANIITEFGLKLDDIHYTITPQHLRCPRECYDC
ncbi:MAG: DUF4277 domain-containing protein, partial [bacterium]|nr:DUF4277 domain-containing protein [bacterium]